MSWADPGQRNTEYDRPSGAGPIAQSTIAPPVGGFPATVTAGTAWSSGLQTSDGYKVLSVAALLTGAGELSVQLYVDPAGQLPQGAAQTAELTANQTGVVNVTGDLPFSSFTVTLTSTTGEVTVTAFFILMNAC